LLEAVHLGFHREEVRERARRFVDERAPAVREAILREVTYRQRGRLEDRARIRLVEARHHPQQRRLAGAIRAAQADALAIGDLPGDVVEEHTIAERLRQL